MKVTMAAAIGLADGELFVGQLAMLILGFSCLISVVAVGVAYRLPRLNGAASNLVAVQTSHRKPTPRVGGVGVFAALCLSSLLVPSAAQDIYIRLVLAAALLFVAGLFEDLGFGVAPRYRLLAAILASVFVVILSGYWLPRVGVPVIDDLMLFGIVGIPVTLFATAGVANAFNLIDGVNGLAGVTAIAAATALAIIAGQAGETDLAQLALLMAAAVLGFLLLNFPFGLIFLGDAGAYSIGFILGWFGIALLDKVPAVTPWAILLTMFWPVADTLLAIYRRSHRKVEKMAPDRLHVHQMVMRGLELCFLGRDRRALANPLTTVVLTPFVVAPTVAGALLWDKPLAAFVAVIFFATFFGSAYFASFRLVRRYRRRFSV